MWASFLPFPLHERQGPDVNPCFCDGTSCPSRSPKPKANTTRGYRCWVPSRQAKNRPPHSGGFGAQIPFRLVLQLRNHETPPPPPPLSPKPASAFPPSPQSLKTSKFPLEGSLKRKDFHSSLIFHLEGGELETTPNHSPSDSTPPPPPPLGAGSPLPRKA